MDERPNFLVFMTEQHRGDCLSIEGHPALLTPNMDAIGGAGARFSACYSTSPVCVPARRSFLSGQFPETHGVVGYAEIGWEAPVTLPGALSAAGYHTCWVGRSMHLTPVRKRYGFDHMVINDHRLYDDYEEFLDRAAPEGSGGYYGTGVMHNDWTARPWHLDETLHHTHWTVNLALEFLRKRDPSCPFFLVVSFTASHPPLIPPAFYMERYLRMELPEPFVGEWATPPANGGLGDGVSSDRVMLQGEALRSCRAGYYGLLNHVDDEIRRLLNPVNGIDRMTDRNTIVMLTSDHGEMLGDHYLWRKSQPYEGASRIPLLIRAPERFGLQKGLVLDDPVCLEDIMPTVLEMAGVEVPDSVDGNSLLPLMRGEDVSVRPYLHIEHAPRFHALTDGQEKYAWFAQDGREQFFDLAADPNECHDLSENPDAPDRVALWRERLIEKLRGRPEGFTDGERLIPGRPYPSALPHALAEGSGE